MGIRHAIMKAEVTVATTTSNSETFVSEETQALPSNLIAHHFNHFIVKYSQALISFGAQCDRKLLHLQIRINRIENALGLLEKKLEPIDSKEVEFVTSPSKSSSSASQKEIVEKPSEHEQNDKYVAQKDETVSALQEGQEEDIEKDGVNTNLKVKDA